MRRDADTTAGAQLLLRFRRFNCSPPPSNHYVAWCSNTRIPRKKEMIPERGVIKASDKAGDSGSLSSDTVTRSGRGSQSMALSFTGLFEANE